MNKKKQDAPGHWDPAVRLWCYPAPAPSPVVNYRMSAIETPSVRRCPKILINLFGIRYPSSASVIRYPSVPFIIKLGSLAYFESKRFNQLSSTLVGMSIISPLVWIAPPDGA